VRVCLLTHYFPPEVGAPQTRIELLARTLAARGVSVTVHAGFHNYPGGVVIGPYRNRPWLRERRDGISIVRSAVYPAANRGFARRLGDHAAFALSALATSTLSGPADVVVGETPPLFTAASGAAYARLKHAAYVPYVADRWPASAVELGALRHRRAIAAATALERSVYRAADLILAPTEGIVTALARVPEAGGKARRVWPVVDVSRFAPAPPGHGQADAAPGPLRVLFAGTVGLAQGLAVLVEASRLAGPEVVRTTIAGDGADAPAIRALLREQSVDNVGMLGTVAADRVPGLYAQCDASAVLLRDLPIFRAALPTKLLEAMAAGRPVLLSARGESEHLVNRSGAGLVVAPGDPPALAGAFRRLHSDHDLRRRLGLAGRNYAETHFGAQRAADEWIGQLSDAVSEHARANSRRSGRAAGGRYRADREQAHVGSTPGPR
jgi:glycosyltransferase involved in cell wall biosynthesis